MLAASSIVDSSSSEQSSVLEVCDDSQGAEDRTDCLFSALMRATAIHQGVIRHTGIERTKLTGVYQHRYSLGL